MRPARERDAAREAEERLRLVVHRSRRGLWVMVGLGLLALLLAFVLLFAS
ncbi:MAG: hypothetical protein AB7F97_09560 [Solirubrobacterales bacterium]